MNPKIQKRSNEESNENSKKPKKSFDVHIEDSTDRIELDSIEELSDVFINKIQIEKNKELICVYQKIKQETKTLQKTCVDVSTKFYEWCELYVCDKCLGYCDEFTSSECNDGKCPNESNICNACETQGINKCSMCDVSSKESLTSINDVIKINTSINLNVNTMEDVEILLEYHKPSDLLVVDSLLREIKMENKRKDKMKSILEAYHSYINQYNEKLYDCFVCSNPFLEEQNNLKKCHFWETNRCNNQICEECYDEYKRIICDQCKLTFSDSTTANKCERSVCGTNLCIDKNYNYDVISQNGKLKIEIISITEDVFKTSVNEEPSLHNIRYLILIPRNKVDIKDKNDHLETISLMLDGTQSIKDMIDTLLRNEWFFCDFMNNIDFVQFTSTYSVDTNDLVNLLKK